MGIRFEDVDVTPADTQLTTHALGALASRVTYVAGNAVRRAAMAARQQLLESAAALLETAMEDLEVRDGRVMVRGARVAECHPDVVQRWPLVAETLRHVATPRIRNMATIGGGLAHADPNQDPLPMFAALDARVLVQSSSGARAITASAFFIDYYETALREGEMVIGVDVPMPTPGSGGVYLKYTPRSVDDYATVSAAAVVRLDSDGKCRDARLVLGAVGVTPVVVPVAGALVGEAISEHSARVAAELARDLVDPIDDVRGSSEYKRDMAVVFGRRALLAAASRATPD